MTRLVHICWLFLMACSVQGSALAQGGYLHVFVTDTDNNAVSNLSITCIRGCSTELVVQGKAKISLPQQTRPGEQVILRIVKRNARNPGWIIVSPPDGLVNVPPFDNRTSNAVLVIVVRKANNRPQAKNATKQQLTYLQAEVIRLEQWRRIPITDLTLGFILNRAAVEKDRNEGYPTPPIKIQISLERQAYINLPQVDISEPKFYIWRGLYGVGQEGELRVSVKEHLPMFPKTVGDLIGHELKVRENELRPWSIIKSIRFYHRYQANTPFLVLEDTSSEYVGRYYMRIWYPRKRVESSDGIMYDHRPFVITTDLFRGNFKY